MKNCPCSYSLKVPNVFEECLSYEQQIMLLEKQICFLSDKVKQLEDKVNGTTE